MKVQGAKRWVVLTFLSLLSGTMVYTPYIRFNYYDQMVIVFTQYKPIVDEASVNTFIGSTGLIVGVVSMIMYVVGGILADKFRERNLVCLGGLLLAIGTLWYSFIPSAVQLLMVHGVLALGVGFMWSAYNKTTRKLGTSRDQGRMFSTSEFIRGLVGTALGFMGVGLLDQAILPSGVTDPQLVGQQFSLLLVVNAGVFLALTVICWFLIPKDLVGNEEAADAVQAPFSAKFVVDVLKLPGVWLCAFLIFFCYSVTACASGYLGTYTVQVLGIDTTTASSFAIVRNYIIAALSTLLIGFVALFLKSEVKTLGAYLGITGVCIVLLLLFEQASGVNVAITFLFAFFYTGMRGLYFATLAEVRVPVHLMGIATGIVSVICYTPDIFFAQIAGIWLDSFGNDGFVYIWIWAVACCLLGAVTAFITYRYAKKRQAELDGAVPVQAA